MNEFEKKSERIEIRVSHSKKQAFNDACEQGGDTPSGALRRFIDSYIRRADNDAFKDGLRALGRMAKRHWLPLSAAAAALLVGGYFTGQALRPAPQDGPIVTASINDFPPIDYTLFAAYDKNANGVLDLGEVAENDEHLHRVLNLDGKAGISPAEFYERGTMSWAFIKKNSVKKGDGEIDPNISVINDGESSEVEFNLLDAKHPKIIVRPVKKTVKDVSAKSGQKLFGFIKYRAQTETKLSEPMDRVVSWERGKTRPVLSFSNHGYRVRAVDPS